MERPWIKVQKFGHGYFVERRTHGGSRYVGIGSFTVAELGVIRTWLNARTEVPTWDEWRRFLAQEKLI